MMKRMNEVDVVNDGPYYQDGKLNLKKMHQEILPLSPLILEHLSFMKPKNLKKELKRVLLLERIVKISQERHVKEILELKLQRDVKTQEEKERKKHAKKEAKKEKKGLKTKIFNSLKNINLKNHVKKIHMKKPSFNLKILKKKNKEQGK